MALEICDIAEAAHVEPIHERRLVEAFPNAYLAALMDEGDFTSLSRNASDVFWRRLCDSGALVSLWNQLLPGRALSPAFDRLTDHEERAGTVCALTALGVVRGSYVAVGDTLCGDIILPPLAAWGTGSGREPWLKAVLEGAALRLRRPHERRRGFREARMYYGDGAPPHGAT